jgi:hypothetical protein
MSRSKDKERYFQHQQADRLHRVGGAVKDVVLTLFPGTGKAAALGAMYGAGRGDAPLEATKLTADTCCALGVHSQWCGCEQ